MAYSDRNEYNRKYEGYERGYEGYERGYERQPGSELSRYPADAPRGYSSPVDPYSPHPRSSPGQTTVIVQQPQVMQLGPPPMMPQNVRDWSSGMCSCFDDMGTCLSGWCCNCCLWSKIAGRLNENPCVLCCVPGAAINLRTKMRTMYGIRGTMCRDCCEIEFCGCCAVCQMERELQTMGMA